MEKRKPHYDLKTLKKLLSKETTRRVTETAQEGAALMGYPDEDAMLQVIQKLCSEHFYKSMTTKADSKIWQDVYKFKDEEKKLYIKLQICRPAGEERAILVQFKKDEGGFK